MSFKKRIIFTEIIMGIVLFVIACISNIDNPDRYKLIPTSTVGIAEMIILLVALGYMIAILLMKLKKKFVITEEQRSMIEISAYPAAAIVMLVLVVVDIIMDLFNVTIQLKPGMMFYPISLGVFIHGFFVLRNNKRLLLGKSEVEEF